MYALAEENQAPSIFKRKNRWGVPFYSLGVSAFPSALAFMFVKVGSDRVSLSLINQIDYIVGV